MEDTKAEDIIPVLMVGGPGERLWPLSTAQTPKPFLRLLQDTSTFDMTLARLAAIRARPPVIIANCAHEQLIRARCAEYDVTPRLVLEPEGRDTALAVAAATLVVARSAGWPATAQSGPVQEVPPLLVMPCDLVLDNEAGFARTVRAGVQAARSGAIVTFGIQPGEASSAFGYIKPGATWPDRPHDASITCAEPDARADHADAASPKARIVTTFVEKPDQRRAQILVDRGYLWNSGHFGFCAPVMLAEMECHCPQVLAAARAAVSEGIHLDDCVRLAGAPYRTAPRISIDHAVMEKSARCAVITAEFGMADIGNWQEIWRLARRDGRDNARIGPVRVVSGTGNYLHSTGPEICVVDCDDLVVVAHEERILIAARQNAAFLKDRLKSP